MTHARTSLLLLACAGVLAACSSAPPALPLQRAMLGGDPCTVLTDQREAELGLTLPRPSEEGGFGQQCRFDTNGPGTHTFVSYVADAPSDVYLDRMQSVEIQVVDIVEVGVRQMQVSRAQAGGVTTCAILDSAADGGFMGVVAVADGFEPPDDELCTHGTAVADAAIDALTRR